MALGGPRTPDVASDIGIGDEAYYRRWYGDRDWRFYRELLCAVIRDGSPGPILDVGAGVGYFVECAQRWGLDCTGIEGSEDAVRLGRERYRGLRLQRHVLGTPLPFCDRSYQTAVMNQVVEHLAPATARATLLELRRVLEPGGLLLVLSPGWHNVQEREMDPTHVNLYTPSSLRALLRETGFERISSFDEPRRLLGRSAIAARAMQVLFRCAPLDRLSASANARAYKPRP